jgi:hypothetical protein
MTGVDEPLAEVIRCMGDAFLPSLKDDAEKARAAGDVPLATYYDFSGGQTKDLPEKVGWLLLCIVTQFLIIQELLRVGGILGST